MGGVIKMAVARKAVRKRAEPASPVESAALEAEVSQVKQAYGLIEEEIATLKLEPGQAVSE